MKTGDIETGGEEDSMWGKHEVERIGGEQDISWEGHEVERA